MDQHLYQVHFAAVHESGSGTERLFAAVQQFNGKRRLSGLPVRASLVWQNATHSKWHSPVGLCALRRSALARGLCRLVEPCTVP
jgi:hypothetical protein